MTREKVIIDQASLTFADLADVEEATGLALSELFEKSQSRGMAALVWVTVRRTDPTFTLAQALEYGPADVENLEEDTEGKVPGANDGAKPARLRASGT